MPSPVALVKPTASLLFIPNRARGDPLPDLYLLHFDPPYRHARHYLGYAVGTGRGRSYAKDQAAGLALGAHELVQAAQWDGCEISVAAVFVGDGRAEQRRMRANGSLSRFCPICLSAGTAHR